MALPAVCGSTIVRYTTIPAQTIYQVDSQFKTRIAVTVWRPKMLTPAVRMVTVWPSAHPNLMSHEKAWKELASRICANEIMKTLNSSQVKQTNNPNTFVTTREACAPLNVIAHFLVYQTVSSPSHFGCASRNIRDPDGRLLLELSPKSPCLKTPAYTRNCLVPIFMLINSSATAYLRFDNNSFLINSVFLRLLNRRMPESDGP
ncbi:unnamed protein product [Nesidiocoris tenuis]|uniref:Uncharacterized protein n=1 Tax=Nesidiocoris tenuis TaxID=355587 RepID=A0A6H5H4T1_9HEMI|nr:unnamed protein product [Nesidiocoris tenuis]